MGVNPLDEIEKWLNRCESGEAGILVVGNRGLGKDKWIVLDVTQTYNIVYNRGEVYSATVEVTLEEYLEAM